MPTKTAPILDETHKLIVNKQLEMKKKHRITMKISDIIDVIVAKNIHMLEKYMGLNIEKDKSDNLDNMESGTKDTKPNTTFLTEDKNAQEIVQKED